MSTESFIANRIVSRNKANFSRPIVVIAIISIALGLTVMILSVAILTGFQMAIREKVIGFGGHIQIHHFQETQSLEPVPIDLHPPFLNQIRQIKGVRHVQAYATKAGIVRTGDQIQGMVLKGIGRDFDWSFFNDKITEGRTLVIPDTGKSNDILISKYLSDLLRIGLNDDLRMYFITGPNVLGRKFKVAGVYESGMEEFDKMFIIGDMRHIQRLNQWDSGKAGGFEVLIEDFDELDRIGSEVYSSIGFSLDASTIIQRYPQIFDWLKLQDINVVIILALMILVSGITMISTLLILILERTSMIGILKALGMKNTGIRRIFLYNAMYIIGIGMCIGNIAGITLSLLQKKFGIVSLAQESYYVSVVPVHLDLLTIILINAVTFIVCTLILIIPSMIVTRINPVRAIRFK